MSAMPMFALFAILAATCSLMVILAKDAVVSAVFLVADLFVLACIYAMLGADFVAAIQVLVYAGAIVILFLFVIMILNIEASPKRLKMGALDVFMLITVLVGFLILAFNAFQGGELPMVTSSLENLNNNLGNTHQIGIELFTRYLWPFELASIVILLAVVAAILISKKVSKPAAVKEH